MVGKRTFQLQVPQPLKPTSPRDRAPQKKPAQWEAQAPPTKEYPHLLQLEDQHSQK